MSGLQNDLLARLRVASLLGMAGAGTLVATPATAWWRGGVWIGVPPGVVAPPVYYPPVYYPPAYYPPAYAYAPRYDAPPGPASPGPQKPAHTQNQSQAAYGSTCYAGVYVCMAPAQSPVGQGCTCPGLGAPSYGTVD